MARITRARMNADADYWENTAASRADAAAADGKAAAADPTKSAYQRQCAARAAQIHREQAADYRDVADALRAGEVPDGYEFD
ncbi:type IV secretory pathway TrbL component [Streptomyces umbrinus]|uniref:Type IV secretory pathway TrbL component n=1 Tax=Streptomyces umbrinus TaxID=67370 RepID=A0ABU0SG00_9ACTN|nr:hypothetical protein [Streptomyces umbrinus]MDQ1022472.1 type IV secretory pathway TrbL component [Streptomyces umbrinus]